MLNYKNYRSVDLRYKRTLNFLKGGLNAPGPILDLGEPNPFTKIMLNNGYEVLNTYIDLDEEPEKLQDKKVKAVTAFEILEHLVNPLGVLKNLQAEKLFTTVPLNLWFAEAYKNEQDPWDCHFHEFEDWQFDWLLDKAGWKIIRSEKWNSPVLKIGIRPLLRLITPRYYAVEAIRK